MVIVKRIMVIVKEEDQKFAKKVYHTWFAGSKHALVISATLNDSWYAFSDPITGAYVTNGKWILKFFGFGWLGDLTQVTTFVKRRASSFPPPKSNVDGKKSCTWDKAQGWFGIRSDQR